MSLIKKLLRHLGLAYLALTLCSCFDGREEIWLNEDASGAARITFSLPVTAAHLQGGETGVRDKITGFLESSAAFSSYSLDVTTAGSSLEIDLAVTFDNALDLATLAETPAAQSLPAAGRGMLGETTLTFSGLNLDFHRTINLPKALPGANFIPRATLENHYLTTIVHLPRSPKTHNASPIPRGTKTLTWKTPLAVALKQPVTNTFTMPLPIPWLTISMALALILLIAVTLIHYLLKKRKQTR